jgi:hypothetical protein
MKLKGAIVEFIMKAVIEKGIANGFGESLKRTANNIVLC